MRMNHPEGKRLLATVRGGDFAHAGEEEAIQLAWEKLPKNPDQLCLDAGCGRGGTAAFVQSAGWGRVTGVDIDAESIGEAQWSFPEGNFHAADISTVGTLFPARFALIYAFNAFYAFPDQTAALQSLAAAAGPGSRLCIFDYVDRGGLAESAFGSKPETQLWKCLRMETMEALFQTGGWHLTECIEVHDEYRRWYRGLVEKFYTRRPELNERFSPALVEYATGYYESMLQAVEKGVLGGVIVYGGTQALASHIKTRNGMREPASLQTEQPCPPNPSSPKTTGY